MLWHQVIRIAGREPSENDTHNRRRRGGGQCAPAGGHGEDGGDHLGADERRDGGRRHPTDVERI